jgi:hypothetical protein
MNLSEPQISAAVVSANNLTARRWSTGGALSEGCRVLPVGVVRGARNGPLEDVLFVLPSPA